MTDPEGPAVYREVETKLEVNADAVLTDPLLSESVRARGLMSATAAVVHTLEATYYDTEQLDLLRSAVTLRRRTGGEDAGWHLKLPGSRSDDPSLPGGRTEMRLPLDRGAEVPSELADIVRGAARGRELQVVAVLRTQRTVTCLLDAGGELAVEIADDIVRSTRPGVTGTQQWREVEVELIGGTAEQLAATVTALTSGGARASERVSKLATALPAAPPDRTPLESAAAVAVGELAGLRDELITADRGLRLQVVGSAGQARVAVQEIRTVLRLHRQLFDGDVAESLRRRFRKLWQILRAATDIEGIDCHLTAGLDEEPEDFARAAAAVIREEMVTRTASARVSLKALISADGYFQLLRDLDDFSLDPPLSDAGRRPVAEQIPVQLDHAGGGCTGWSSR